MFTYNSRLWKKAQRDALSALNSSNGNEIEVMIARYLNYTFFGTWRRRWLIFLSLLPPFCILTFIQILLYGKPVFVVKIYGVLARTSTRFAFISPLNLADYEIQIAGNYDEVVVKTSGLFRIITIQLRHLTGSYYFQISQKAYNRFFLSQ